MNPRKTLYATVLALAATCTGSKRTYVQEANKQALPSQDVVLFTNLNSYAKNKQLPLYVKVYHNNHCEPRMLTLTPPNASSNTSYTTYRKLDDNSIVSASLEDTPLSAEQLSTLFREAKAACKNSN